VLRLDENVYQFHQDNGEWNTSPMDPPPSPNVKTDSLLHATALNIYGHVCQSSQ
jgi:hypothetical protein